MQGTGGAEMQMARDLSLLAPEIAVLLTAVGALVFEMLRLPRVSLPFAVVGLLVGYRPHRAAARHRDDGLHGHLQGRCPECLGEARATAGDRPLHGPRLPGGGGTDREGTVYALLSFTALGALVLAGAGDLMFVVLGVLLLQFGLLRARGLSARTTVRPRRR